MTITLSEETRSLLQEKLKNSGYRSADEVVRAALEALNQLDELTLDEQTTEALDRAEDQIDSGDVRDWKDVREQVRATFRGE